MEQNYTPDSFKKGQQFEKFVEERLFPEARYELVTRTNSYEQNSSRFAEDTVKPDFKFRCRETGQEFYVEAKYRSELYYKSLEGLSYNQRDRFYELEKTEGIPIFVVIGYWRNASDPYAVSLIPLSDYSYIKIYRSFLEEYDIPIKPIKPNQLGLKKKQLHNETALEDSKSRKFSLKLFNQNPKLLGLAAMGLLAIILSIYGFSFSGDSNELSNKERLQAIITDYYQSMNSNQVERLPEFLSSDIKSWYGSENMSTNQIIKDAKIHRGKYPFSETKINWDSFKFIEQEDGGFYASYEMIYKAKHKITDDFKVFNLKIVTTWDQNLKLTSIRETKG